MSNTSNHRVRDERIKRLWTQRELARIAGLSPTTVFLAEQGRTPTPLVQQKIALAFGLRREDVFPEVQEVAS